MNEINPVKKIWIVSSEPASTDYGPDSISLSESIFKEEVDVEKLKRMVQEFADSIGDIFDSMESKSKNFAVDSIELNAVMAADGKLGILGSGIGGKVEGSIKFVLKKVAK